MHMEMKRAICLLATLLLCVSLSACGAEPLRASAGELDSGYIYSGNGLDKRLTLREADGNLLTVSVDNLRETPVYLAINGEKPILIEGKSSGSVSLIVEDLLLWGREYIVKCVTAAGDDVEINYQIVQQHKEA